MEILWALWIVSGGLVNSGDLKQPQISAYFGTQEECVRVLRDVQKLAPTKTMQCIGAKYHIR